MLGERIVPQSEVIRAIISGYSPYRGPPRTPLEISWYTMFCAQAAGRGEQRRERPANHPPPSAAVAMRGSLGGAAGSSRE